MCQSRRGQVRSMVSLSLSVFARLMKNASGKSWHEMGDVSCCNASPAALSYYPLPAFLYIIYFRSPSLSLSFSLFFCAFALLATFSVIIFAEICQFCTQNGAVPAPMFITPTWLTCWTQHGLQITANFCFYFHSYSIPFSLC